MLFVYHTNHLAGVAENLPEFAHVRKCEVWAPLHANDTIFTLNGTVRARTMPISKSYCPLSLARTSCIMLFVYHINHLARVPENLPEFARVWKYDFTLPCMRVTIFSG